MDGTIESEGHDRHDINLPGLQTTLLKELIKLNKPLVIVLYHGGIITLDPEIIQGASAILSAGYPGFYGGDVLSKIIFETSNNPIAINRFGKTPVTWYSQKGWKNANFDMLSFDMIKSPGRTYRYYNQDNNNGDGIDYPFGYGLSYTTFKLNGIKNQQILSGIDSIDITITNTGTRTGDNVIFGYFIPDANTIPKTDLSSNVKKQLFDFYRIDNVHSNETSKTVTFQLTPENINLYDNNGKIRIYPGKYQIIITNGDPRSNILKYVALLTCDNNNGNCKILLL